MKQTTFLMTTDSPNESDVLGIIVHITEEGLRLLQALSDRAADFSNNWSAGGSVYAISFELPQGVTVFGLSTSLEDEKFLEGEQGATRFKTEDALLSKDDMFAVKHRGRSTSRMIVTDPPLDTDAVCEIEANHSPEWSLCRFMVVFDNETPYFSALHEHTDGREFTSGFDLSYVNEIFKNGETE